MTGRLKIGGSVTAVFYIGILVASFSFADDPATVLRVVDGDTIVISLHGKEEKVRLIGVDTPEVHESAKLHRDAQRSGKDEKTIRELGAKASSFTKSLIKKRDPVRLEYDFPKRDKYGRILAYVWLEDGQMLNEAIICAGYGNTYTAFPFKQDYKDRFLACQRMAVEKGLGLWGEPAEPPTPKSPSEPPMPPEP